MLSIKAAQLKHQRSRVLPPGKLGPLTLRPDRLGDGTRVAQAVGVNSSDDEQVDGVGEKADDRVRLYLYHVGHSLPCAAC